MELAGLSSSFLAVTSVCRGCVSMAFPDILTKYSCSPPEYATQVIALSAAALYGAVLQSVPAKTGEEKEKAP